MEKIIEQFNLEFVFPSGRLVSPTQTAHVIALMFDMVEGKAKERTACELNELIIHETAVKLLMKDDFPTWLYQVKKGATTVWEHWDII